MDFRLSCPCLEFATWLVYTKLCIYPAIILGSSYYYLHFVNEEPEAQAVLACYQELNSSTEPKSSTSCSKKERASSEGTAKKIFIEAYCRNSQAGDHGWASEISLRLQAELRARSMCEGEKPRAHAFHWNLSIL